MRQIAEDVCELFAEAAAKKRLEISGLIESDVRTLVRGDPGRLRQVLCNLVGNAVKFTERGEIALRVRAQPSAHGATLLRFEVRDTGIGIAHEAQQYIFQAFTQADGSTTRRYGGTGLGLTISRQLVEGMGGVMGVHSQLGAGATFWFTASFGQPTVEMLAPPRYDLSGVRVLIVDDNATNRDVLQHQMMPWGVCADAAADGMSALEMLRAAAHKSASYQLVILDLLLLDMDGIAVAHAIKAEPETANLHIIMLTSVGMRGDAQVAREAGIEGYLTKPVRQNELFACIAQVLGRNTLDATPATVTRHTLSAPSHKHTTRILLAEDNEINLEVALARLYKLGFLADVVTDGEQAVAAFKAANYDIILMDCQMPNMDGYQASAEIRRLEQAQNKPRVAIIALTANALDGDRDRCLAAGMDDHLPKPFRSEQLHALLGHWVKHGKTGV